MSGDRLDPTKIAAACAEVGAIVLKWQEDMLGALTKLGVAATGTRVSVAAPRDECDTDCT